MEYKMIKNYRIWIFSILLLIAPRLLIAEAIVNIEDMFLDIVVDSTSVIDRWGDC